MVMNRGLKRELELRVMNLEAVHLPAFEETAGDNRARIKQLFSGRTQSRVRGDAPIGGQPGVDRAIGYIHVEAAA